MEHGICPIAVVCIVVEILILKCFGPWCHRSRDHTIRYNRFPIGALEQEQEQAQQK